MNPAGRQRVTRVEESDDEVASIPVQSTEGAGVGGVGAGVVEDAGAGVVAARGVVTEFAAEVVGGVQLGSRESTICFRRTEDIAFAVITVSVTSERSDTSAGIVKVNDDVEEVPGPPFDIRIAVWPEREHVATDEDG